LQEVSGACTRNVLNEAAKVPLIPVPDVGVQPRYATQCDFGSHGDSFESNGSEQTADRRVGIAGPNRDEDIVAFIGVQMRLSGSRERPSQAGFVPKLLHVTTPYNSMGRSVAVGNIRSYAAVQTFSYLSSLAAITRRDRRCCLESSPVPTGRPCACDPQS
jgi:hypothetical protein